jgi:PAS domain S-box-containing protein
VNGGVPRGGAEWRDGLVADSVRPILTVVAILYALFTVTHATLLPPDQRLPLGALAGATALTLAAARVWLAVRPLPSALAQPLIAGVTLLVLANAVVHIALSGEAHQTTTIMLALLAAGVFLLSTPWLAAVILAAWAGWFGVGLALVVADPWGHYAFALMSASIIALLAHATRLRAIVRIEELRAADEAQRLRLEAAFDELRRSEERFRTLAQAAFEAIVVHRDGRIIDANPAFAAMFGRDPAAVPGLGVFEIIAPEERAPVAERVAAPGGELYETIGLRGDGTRVQLEVRARPLPWGDGAARVAAMRDVTAQKARERELARALDELRRSNEELERFAYVVSHDLQAPLRTIASFSEMLREDWRGRLDADADQLLGRIVTAATRMRGLLVDLLAYARVGTAEPVFEPTDLERVLATVLDDLAATVADSGAEVTHDPLPTVAADPPQMEQLLANLLGNAIKFRSEEPPRVHVAARREGGRWIVSVRDNGIGIDPRYAQAVFNVFERLHTTGDYPGTGIGLAICQRIVERHGGRIWFESRPNEGATFSFTLPA